MTDELRQWMVAGGVLIRDDHVLLVQNKRRNGELDWSTPGGVIDEGETVIEGLGREVTEETGLAVTEWSGPLYRVEVVAPGFGFHLRVEAHLAVGFDGSIEIDDPDGIVVAAEFVPRAQAAGRLGDVQPWVADPLVEHLVDGVDDGRLYRYRLDGTSSNDRKVTRL